MSTQWYRIAAFDAGLEVFKLMPLKGLYFVINRSFIQPTRYLVNKKNSLSPATQLQEELELLQLLMDVGR